MYIPLRFSSCSVYRASRRENRLMLMLNAIATKMHRATNINAKIFMFPDGMVNSNVVHQNVWQWHSVNEMGGKKQKAQQNEL